VLHCRSISVKVWKSCRGYNSSICTLWPLSIQPKIPEISIRNQMEQTISVRSNQNIWHHLHRWSTLTGFVHLTKVLSPVLLFSILRTRTMTKLAMAWVSLVWSVQLEFTVPMGTWNFWNFKPEFLLSGKCAMFSYICLQDHSQHVMYH